MTLADYMKAHGLDDLAMAEKIGRCSESAVRKWRYGQRMPRVEQLRRIAEVTHGAVTPNDFLLGETSDSSPVEREVA